MFVSADGRVHVADTEQIEAAVTAGALVPVVEGRCPVLAA
jgi:hypothetical protein